LSALVDDAEQHAERGIGCLRLAAKAPDDVRAAFRQIVLEQALHELTGAVEALRSELSREPAPVYIESHVEPVRPRSGPPASLSFLDSGRHTVAVRRFP
jgi:hypothetical protein